MGRLALLGWMLLLAVPPGSLAADTPVASGAAVLVEKENVVDARLKGRPWKPVAVGTELAIGDRLRTGEFSRAAIRFTDLSVLRLDELTDIEVLPPVRAGAKPVPNVQRGGTYFFSREKGNEIQIRTPSANGALRGTEFTVRVAANGSTTMTVLEGEVEMTNPHGPPLLLRSGEQGEAAIGRAPRKTAVIEAINTIQWCLYYPGVIDPAELALTAEDRQRLERSLAAYRSGDLPGALAAHPRGGVSEGARLYRAAVILSTGQVEKARAELRHCRTEHPLRQALEQMIAAVQFRDFHRKSEPTTASEWMAESYYRQSRGNLYLQSGQSRGVRI